MLGVPGQSVSNRLRGKVRWTAGDLAITAAACGVDVADLYPTRTADGWQPAPFVPARREVPPVGLEPTTFGLKAPAPSLADRLTTWVEHIGVHATHWLATRAAASRQTLPDEARKLGQLAIPDPTPPMIPAYRDPATGRLPLD